MANPDNISQRRSWFSRLFHYSYKPNTDVNLKVLTALAVASSISNSIGFLANFFLYGVNIPTLFCGICAVFCWLNLIFGVRSKQYMLFGVILLSVLCVLEFPLLTFAYGSVMYPYMLLGYMGVIMLSGKHRKLLCLLLIVYDTFVIVLSTLHPYLFGPQDPIGLLGSAMVTFLVTIITFSVCILRWQDVYIRQTSEVDPITQALTMEGFTRETEKILKSAVPGQYAILFYDIVSFKSVNAVYGIEAGNQVLRELASRMTRSGQVPAVLVCRQEADRFLLLVETGKLNYSVLPEVCRYRYSNRVISVSLQLNCGIYKITDPAMPIPAMCDRARSVVSHSPLIRSQHYALYDIAVEEKFVRETGTFAMVEDAIAKGEFVPFFQPIVDSRTNKIAGAEALARWIRPDHTVVSPGVFIPILEKKELISDLDDLIIRKVNTFLENRSQEKKKIVPVSVNLSRVDLYNEDLMDHLRFMLKQSSIRDKCFNFEVTETVYEAIPRQISEELSSIRALGAKILIDDFGSGYSSLGMITDFAFDIIKLDMAFARKIDQGDRTRGVIRSLIDLSHTLGAKVIAEGVESRSQYEFLRDNGCDYIQGYYFYRPMSEEAFSGLLDGES